MLVSLSFKPCFFRWISYVEIQLCREGCINYRLIIDQSFEIISVTLRDWQKNIDSKYKIALFDHDNFINQWKK